MAYKSSEKTRAKKNAKRTAMMQAAVQVFAKKGYHAATVRDIVNTSNVAIGTFYFYFPDKETLFLYLYEETADFLLQAIQQAVNQQSTLPNQISAGIQAYVNIGLYDPAVIRLLLVGGVGAVPSLHEKWQQFREKLAGIWRRALQDAMDDGLIAPQDLRIAAEMIAGGLDEIIINLLNRPNPDLFAKETTAEMYNLTMRMIDYQAVNDPV